MLKEINRATIVGEVVPEIEKALSPLRTVTNLLKHTTYEDTLEEPFALYLTLKGVLDKITDIIYDI